MEHVPEPAFGATADQCRSEAVVLAGSGPCGNAPRWRGQVRVPLTREADHEGFLPARRLGGLDTSRIDVLRMVRAPGAWDRGEAEALFRVRIPTVGEEDARRLMRHRERPVRERTHPSNIVLDLLKLHGIHGLHPLKPGFGGRFGVAETATGNQAAGGRPPQRGSSRLADPEWTEKAVSRIHPASRQTGVGTAREIGQTASQPNLPNNSHRP